MKLDSLKSEKAWRKYLAKHAEAETTAINTLPEFITDYVLIIPAFDESPVFFERLLPLLKQNSVLLIVVINQPDSVPNPSIVNSELFNALHGYLPDRTTVGNLTFGKIRDSQSQLLLVDRFQQGSLIPAAQGVGLARKIGADLAIALIDRGGIKQSMLYCTDCDTTIPENYFQPDNDGKVALLYPFKHTNDGSQVAAATALYEFSINYYRAGLNHAGSPYAYSTIGSCIAIDALAYCRAHGFPKRAGGEDFYLLNKLAKLGRIKTLSSPLIEIQPRLSHRIPFGTGPAVSGIITNKDNGEKFTVYHPAVFSELRLLLSNVNNTSGKPSARSILKNLSPDASKVLQGMGIEVAIEKIQQNLSAKTDHHLFIKHFYSWFDAFRTLKFIHGIRDSKYPNLNVCNMSSELLRQCNATWVNDVPGYRPARDSEI